MIHITKSHSLSCFLGRTRRQRRAFTLVELLVVITIISVLVAMMIPAVQAAREAARVMHCNNNLKQIGLTCLGHEQHHKFFPSNGWGWDYVGDPDLGFGKTQPGSWIYNILPYLEAGNIHDLGEGENAASKRVSRTTLTGIVMPMFYCPIRRPAMLYPRTCGLSVANWDYGAVSRVARADYAINTGSQDRCQIFTGPTFADGLTPTYKWPDASDHNSISYQRSQITTAMIKDGISNTLLASEKYLNPASYNTGNDDGDNETLYSGYDNDISRSGAYVPQRDRLGNDGNYRAFGCAHLSSLPILLCDGAVRSIGWRTSGENTVASIDSQVWSNFCNRADGKAIDGKAF